MLLAVSDRLRGHLPPTAVLGRPESDEFMVMMTDLRSPADAVALAESLLEALRPALKVEHYEFAIGASIGIAFHPQHAGTVDELISCTTSPRSSWRPVGWSAPRPWCAGRTPARARSPPAGSCRWLKNPA